MRKLTRTLISKSKSAFLLSIELFNKPTIKYRTEAFSILFSNACELLLKAYIFETSNGRKLSIFRRKKKNQKRESLTIDECIKKVFLNNMDPIRKNIEYISEIRNESSHLIIIQLNPFFSRVFQRGILNYIELIDKWFNISLSETFEPGFISLISDEGLLKDTSLLKKHFNKEDYQSIKLWIDKFKELEKIGEKATIPLKYTIALVKNPQKADITLSYGEKGTDAIILEKYRNPEDTHPLRRKEAMEKIIKGIKYKKIEFTTYDFDAFCFVKGVKKTKRNEYFWKPKYSSGQYSEKLVEEIVTCFNSNLNIRNKLRKQYGNYLKRKRSKRLAKLKN